MTNHRAPYLVASSLGVVAGFALLVLLVGTVTGQSGRRGTRSSSPAPAPSPEAAPVEQPTETKPALSLIVGIERNTIFGDIPLYFYDTVLRACSERLDDSPSVKVNMANREMNRAEAIKLAKAETESHIVLLQLRFDNGRSESGDDLREVYIEYSVFAHTTAKLITSGHTYQQASRAGGVISMPMPGGRASLPLTEQLLKQAARDAAERILSAMNISGRKIPG